MKTRLICLLLCLMFVMSLALTGCKKTTSDEDINNIVDEGSANTKHLTMWVVSEEPVDGAVASDVSDAINNITMTKFSTKLTIRFLTKAEYRQTISDTIRANEDARNQFLGAGAVKDPQEDENAPVETVTNQWGLPEKKYPNLRENQVDILYIEGYDMYEEFVENEWLYSLDSEISSSSQKLTEYISKTLLNAAKIDGSLYAIPNNNTMGEYTYMLLDKELMEECSMDGVYHQGKINGFFNEYIYNYLETVANHYGDSIVPIASSYDECLSLLAHYWSIDPDTYEIQSDKFSFLGFRYTDVKSMTRGTPVMDFQTLFTDKVFSENFLKLNEYKLAGSYFGEATEGKKSAISFCTGDIALYDELLENYYPVIVKYPTVTMEDAFANMFGVCTYSVDPARSMQIITYLNTNADFRNLLQYGVEGVHYKLVDEDGKKIVARLTDKEDKELYVMDVFKTGNAFIAYPAPDMDPDIWEVGKRQNREAKIEPLFQFDLGAYAREIATSPKTYPKLGSNTFLYTYISGYEKSVLAQNELLGKWIATSDSKGPGVYVLHTHEQVGQNISAKVFIYNNNIAGGSVEITNTATGVSANYTGTVGEGCLLTVVEFYGRKNASQITWDATVNGAGVPTQISYHNSYINFDPANTDHYQAIFYPGLTKSMIENNTVVWEWTKSCKGTATEENPFVGTYAHTTGEGEDAKTVYTCMFYAKSIKKQYTMSFDCKTVDGKLIVYVDYNRSENDLKDRENRYALALVRIEADAAVEEVEYRFTLNGAPLTVQTNDFTQNPRINPCGDMDTDMIKYFDEVNTKIVELINACTNLDQLKTLLDDLKLLFTRQKDQPYNDDALQIAVTKEIKTYALQNYLKNKDLTQFYYYLECAVSYETVIRLEKDPQSGEIIESTNSMISGEPYTYYKSPYAIYYGWLETFK